MRAGIITNDPLDEQQQLIIQQEKSYRRHTHISAIHGRLRGYVFTPRNAEELIRQTAVRSMATWSLALNPHLLQWLLVDRNLARSSCSIFERLNVNIRCNETRKNGLHQLHQNRVKSFSRSQVNQEKEDNLFFLWVYR